MARRISFLDRQGTTRFQIDSCGPQLAAVRSGKIKFHALSHGLYPGQRLGPAQIPGISSLGFWDGVSTQDWGLEPHRNEGLEICFLETGSMAFSVEAKDFAIHSGHLTMTRPWQLHKLGAPHIGPGKLHWLIFDVGARRPNQAWRWPRWVTLTEANKRQLTRKLQHDENVVWSASPAIASAFSGLADCVLKWKKPLTESRALCLLNQLLVEILTTLTKERTLEDDDLASRRHTVKLFLDELEKNGANNDEPWSLGKMAAHCGMGVTAFSKYCRQLVNSSPVEYLNQCRLQHAARQLKENQSLSIIQAALENGFSSSQYFATRFRIKYRVSPSEYQKLTNLESSR